MPNRKSLDRVTTIPDDAVEIFGGAYKVDREGNFYRSSTTQGTRKGYKLRPFWAGKRRIVRLCCTGKPPFGFKVIDVDQFYRETLPALFNESRPALVR